MLQSKRTSFPVLVFTFVVSYPDSERFVVGTVRLVDKFYRLRKEKRRLNVFDSMTREGPNQGKDPLGVHETTLTTVSESKDSCVKERLRFETPYTHIYVHPHHK